MKANLLSGEWLENRPVKVSLFIGLSVLYFVSVYGYSLAKPLWYDEVITWQVAHQPTLPQVWQQISQDTQAPLGYLLPWVSAQIFGPGEMALRLPGALGVWFMGLCLYKFVSRRRPVVYALLAALFPFLTDLFTYAYEARPYGLVLGACGGAIVCWQGAHEGSRRWLWLMGLAVSLAFAISSHYYAIVLLAPLGIAEITWSVTNRRIAWPVWLAMLAGSSILLVYLPLIRSALQFTNGYVTDPVGLLTPYFFYTEITHTFRYSLFILIMVTAVILMTFRPVGERQPVRETVPLADWVLVLGLIAYPAFLAMSSIITHAFLFRYVLPGVIGFSLGVALVLSSFESYYPLLSKFATGLTLALFGVLTLQAGPLLFKTQATPYSSQSLLATAPGSLPIAVANPLTYLPDQFYAPGALKQRLVYLADIDRSYKLLGYNVAERNLLNLKTWVPVTVYSYGDYLQTHEQFLVYNDSGVNWLIQQLILDGNRLELLARQGGEDLYRVTVIAQGQP